MSDEMKENKKMKEEKLLELQFWNDGWDILIKRGKTFSNFSFFYMYLRFKIWLSPHKILATYIKLKKEKQRWAKIVVKLQFWNDAWDILIKQDKALKNVSLF